METKIITDRKELAKIETLEGYVLILTNTILHLFDENERLKKVYHITNKDWIKQQKKIQEYEQFINKIAEWDMYPSNPFRTEVKELLKKHKTT